MLLTYACIDLERGQRSILDWGFMLSICSLRASLSMAGPCVTALLCPCVSWLLGVTSLSSAHLLSHWHSALTLPPPELCLLGAWLLIRRRRSCPVLCTCLLLMFYDCLLDCHVKWRSISATGAQIYQWRRRWMSVCLYGACIACLSFVKLKYKQETWGQQRPYKFNFSQLI